MIIHLNFTCILYLYLAWIKMGDYYWYGCQGNRNTAQAAVMYANGALKGDPHVRRVATAT